MMQQIRWKEGLHSILKNYQVELSFERTRNHGVEPWCMLNFLCFQCFLIFLHLIYSFVYVWSMMIPLCFLCCIVTGFPWFSSCLFPIFSFYALRVLGIGWGKRNVNGTRREMNEIKHVMKDKNEARYMSKWKLKERIRQQVGLVGSIGING